MLVFLNPGKPLTIYNIASICGKAYPLAFTPSNVMSGYLSSGVWPFNRKIFSDHEYFASLVSVRPTPEPSTCVTSSQASSFINAEELVDDPGFPLDSMIVSTATGPTKFYTSILGPSSSSDPLLAVFIAQWFPLQKTKLSTSPQNRQKKYDLFLKPKKEILLLRVGNLVVAES